MSNNCGEKDDIPTTEEEQAARQEAYRCKTVRRLYNKIRYKDDCWIWTGAQKVKYGNMLYMGKYWLAHRVSYKIFYTSFNPALDVLHKCDTPLCVNPLHLYQGTHQDNMKDRTDRKGTYQPKGSKQRSAKLIEKQIPSIYYDTRTHKQIAHDYSVHESLISKIKRRISWKHVMI